jgi:nitroreductase
MEGIEMRRGTDPQRVGAGVEGGRGTGRHGGQDWAHLVADALNEATAGRQDGFERTRRVVAAAAVAAPSIHNAQPWLLRIRPDRVDLFRDRRRVFGETDPHAREATISCGAALFGIRLALVNLGHSPQVHLLPDPERPDHLATVLPGPRGKPTAEEERLFEAVPRRRSNRRPFAPSPVPDHVVAELEVACREEGVWVREIRGPSRRSALRDLCRKAADILLETEEYREELATWARHARYPARGFPVRPLLHRPSPDGAGCPVDGLRRELPAGPEVADADLGHEVLMVVGSRTDTPQDWLRAGQALYRMLLTATERGLGSSTFTQVTEVPGLRGALASVLRLPDLPQFVVRLGYPTHDVPWPPRRSMQEVIVT